MKIEVSMPDGISMCHNFNYKAMFDDITKKHYCSMCMCPLKTNIKEVLHMWADLWLHNMEINAEANIELMKNSPHDALNIFKLNRICALIENEMVLYIDNPSLRYRLLSGPSIDMSSMNTPEAIMDKCIDWSRQIHMEIKK